MELIKVVIKEEGKPQRESIHPRAALANFQQVFKNELVDYYVCDEFGNRIKKEVIPTKSAQQRAYDAMLERAKALKIKGAHLMSEDNLLKAIQEDQKVPEK